MLKQDDLSPLQMAYYLLNEAEEKSEKLDMERKEPIAVIGMGCRFPGGANDPETFWELLKNGFDGSSEIPKDRWNVEEYFDPDPSAPGKMYVKKGGFLNVPIDQFDPLFFGISPREAPFMDPQQRLILEVSWEALENAGINPKKLENSLTGVFMGLMTHDYSDLLAKFQEEDRIDAYQVMGTTGCVLPGRVSYTLGLQGPSFPIDTACSASLVALDSACQSLRIRDCNLALAGAVSLILYPELLVSFCKAKMLSPDGSCKTFDAHADGYARGEGCGVLVLKRLGDALRDGDRILALIKASGVNHNGPSSGLTVPNGQAQEALLKSVWKKAQIEGDEIDYIEAHGTGTSLGDPIEFRAIESVLKGKRSSDHPLWIGSVKTNIGHLEAAAGVAGLIKVILALQNETIPPHIHFHEINPLINLRSISANIPVEPIPWKQGKKPRVAGVSAFCLGGTNAHVVLEEAPQIAKKTDEKERPLHLFTLSAKSEKALQDLMEKYRVYLSKHPELDVADVAYTANIGRAPFEYRFHAIVADRKELLEALNKKENVISKVPPQVSPIAFRFADKDTTETDQQHFENQIFLFELWKSWGIKPQYVMGSCSGEYAALVAAEILKKEDCLKLIQGDRTVPLRSPRLGFISSKTGKLSGNIQLDEIGKHPIKWDESLQELKKLGSEICIEIGSQIEWKPLLELLADLYRKGVAIDWEGFDAPYARQKVTLPTYPFQREAYWAPLSKKSGKITTPVKQTNQIPQLLNKLQNTSSEDRYPVLLEYVRFKIHDILRLAAHQALRDDQEFLDAGMDSLASMELKGYLQNDLGKDFPLPQNVIFEYPTFSKLARYLSDQVSQYIPSKSSEEIGFDPSSLLVSIQPHGSYPPLFCIHPIDGDIFGYTDLTKSLGREFPIYAVRAKGFLPHEKLPTSLEEIKRDYLKAIRSKQQRGPYQIVGWSAGTLIASEIVKELEREGEQVDLLVLLDPPNSFFDPDFLQISSEKLFFGFLNNELDASIEIADEKNPLKLYLVKAQSLGKLPLELEYEEFLKRYKIFENLVLLLKNSIQEIYEFRNVKKLYLFESEKSVLEMFGFTGSSKRPLFKTTGLSESHQFACSHYEIVKTPFIDKIATTIREQIESSIRVLT